MDWKNCTKNDFKIIFYHHVQDLRDLLREQGVWVQKDATISIAKALVNTVRKWREWPEDERFDTFSPDASAMPSSNPPAMTSSNWPALKSSDSPVVPSSKLSPAMPSPASPIEIESVQQPPESSKEQPPEPSMKQSPPESSTKQPAESLVQQPLENPLGRAYERGIEWVLDQPQQLIGSTPTAESTDQSDGPNRKRARDDFIQASCI